MIEYRRKYNSKYKNGKWKDIEGSHISAIDWNYYEFRIANKIYTSPTKEFRHEREKIIMWGRLIK